MWKAKYPARLKDSPRTQESRTQLPNIVQGYGPEISLFVDSSSSVTLHLTAVGFDTRACLGALFSESCRIRGSVTLAECRHILVRQAQDHGKALQ
jgi:hypothetical protein